MDVNATTPDINATNASDHIVAGWISQPNNRGTFDIIWPCLFAVFLCSWTSLCINVPATKDSKWVITQRKLLFFSLSMIGPEFAFQIAFGQWTSARQSIKLFHDSGYTEWTTTHGFFADMGGILLQPSDWRPFPIDAKQYYYLVTHKYLPYYHIPREEIEDKNKVDMFLRLITLVQITSFVLTSLARSIQHLALTTLEISTLGVIFCTILTHICWLHKPADVQHPIILDLKIPLTTILQDAGIHLLPGPEHLMHQTPSQSRLPTQTTQSIPGPFYRTPLDFVSRHEWAWTQWWSSITHIATPLGIDLSSARRAPDRIPNDLFPYLPRLELVGLEIVVLVYAGINFVAWGLYFPTTTEKVLWRVASGGMLGCLLGFMVVDAGPFFRMFPSVFADRGDGDGERGQGREDCCRQGRPSTWYARLLLGVREGLHPVAEWLRNNSEDRDPELKMPLRKVLPFTALAILYCVARAYMLVADFVGLRELPASAFRTVTWF